MKAKRSRARTLVEYSTTINTDGVMIRVKCFRIDSETGSRVEIKLEGAAQHATVDVPIAKLPHLKESVAQAAQIFAATLRTRMRPDGMMR